LYLVYIMRETKIKRERERERIVLMKRRYSPVQMTSLLGFKKLGHGPVGYVITGILLLNMYWEL